MRVDVIVTCNPNPSSYFKMNVRMNPNMIPDFLRSGSSTLTVAHLCGFALLRNPQAPQMNQINWQEMKCFAVEGSNSSTPQTWEYQNLRPIYGNYSEPVDERITLTYLNTYSTSVGSANEYWAMKINDGDVQVYIPPRIPLTQSHWLNLTTNQVKEKKTAQEYGVAPLSTDATFETVVLDLVLGKRYEIVMISDDLHQQHPWHLHGYTLEFINYNSLPLNHSNINWDEELQHTIHDQVEVLSFGDSWTVMNNSYVVFRFTADNPGPWFIHCHVEWHMALGRALILMLAILLKLLKNSIGEQKSNLQKIFIVAGNPRNGKIF